MSTLPYLNIIVYWNVRAAAPGSRRVQQVQAWLAARGATTQWIWCGRGYPDAGTQLQQAIAAGGIDLVLAAGGDGTLHYTSALLAHTGIPMAVVPSGTGNGMARHFGIPLHWRRALQVLEQGRVAAVDLGRWNDRIFMGFAGLGLDAVVASAFEQEPGERSLWKYTRLTVRSLLRYRPVPLTLMLDDNPTPWHASDALLLTVANVSQFGSGARIAAGASAADGRLEVCLLRQHPLWASVPLAIRLFGSRLRHSGHYYRRAQATRLTITAATPCPLQLDGEPVAPLTGTAELHCLPGALHLVVPATHFV